MMRRRGLVVVVVSRDFERLSITHDKKKVCRLWVGRADNDMARASIARSPADSQFPHLARLVLCLTLQVQDSGQWDHTILDT